MASIIEARLMSITGEEVYRIIGNTERGAILSCTFEWEKIGGLRNFEMNINKNNDVPLFNGMRFDFYFRDDTFLTNTKIFSGYSELTPVKESNSNIMIISGKGYYWKLENKILNQDFSSVTIQEVIEYLDLTDLDIQLSIDYFSTPTGTYSFDFKDKNYIQVLDTLLMIANKEYATTQYIWLINEKRELCFYPLPSTGENVNQKFFEGFDFQAPEVSYDNEIINKVLIYRPTLADSKQTELVGTFEDTASQDINGIHDKKIMIGDYVDNNAAEDFADAVLSEYSMPKKLIAINNFYRADSKIINGLIAYDDGLDADTMEIDRGTGLEDFEYRVSELSEERFRRIWLPDFYGISTKPQEKITLVNECDSLDIWSQSLSNSAIIESSDYVFTGRQVFKWTRDASQPAGDYIELSLNNIIGNLIDVRFNIYFSSYVANITFTFYDSEGNTVTITPDINNSALVNNWVQFVEDVRSIEETKILYVKKASNPYAPMEVTNDLEDKHLLISHTDEQVIRNLVKVRITLGAGTVNADIIYIDRIEAKNKSWEYSRLSLDKAKYTIDKDYVISDIEFGNKKVSIVDEIKDGIKKGDLAFDMFAKE